MLRYAYTLLIVALSALQSQAVSYVWNGSVSTNWANANNWTPAGVPGSGDNVSISTATNQPTLDTTRSIADLTLNSGSQLNLAGFTLTITGNAVFTSATTVSGKLLCSAFTASNSQFDTELSITTTAFSTNGCTYNEPFLVNYSGNTGSNNGGNTFHSIAHINQSGSMPLFFGMANPDIFHDSLFAQVSGSREICFGTNTSGTQFKGYCRFTRGTGAILFGNASHGALFEGKVEIASTSSSGLLSTLVMRFQNCVFDTSAQLSIHTSGFSRGQLDLMNCTFNTAVSLTLSGVSSLLVRGGTQFIDNVNISAPSVFLQQLVAQQSAEFTKTGSGIDQSVGPISASGTFTLNNTGSGSFYVEGDYGDQFNHVVLNNSHAAGVLAIARRGTSTIVSGNLTVNSTAGVVGIGTSATATAISIAGSVNANASGGAVLLNHVQLPSSASLVVGSLASTLQLQNLQYACSTPFTVNQSSGAGRLVLKPGCVFNTKAILTVPRIQIEGSTFNDSLVVNCMVAGISSSGGFTANGPVVFNAQHSSGNWELNYHGGTAIYHGDVYINRFGSGTITFGYAGAHDFYGNLYFNGTQATSDGNNNHFNFKGNTNQSIASTNTHQLGFLRLGVNKPGGALSIDAKVNVLANLSLTKGNIQVQPTANFGLSTSATVSGGSDSSYVEGFMSKQGTAAFTFPLGGNGSYAPLGIDAVASTCTFKAQYIAEDPDSLYPRSQKDTTLGFINRCGYWNLDRTAGTQNTKVTLGWSNTVCYSNSPNDASVAEWGSNTWNNRGNSSNSGNSIAGSVKSTLMTSTFPLLATLGGKCISNVSYRLNYDTLFYGLSGIVFMSPGDPKQIELKIDNNIAYTGKDSIFEFTQFTNGSLLKLYYYDRLGCDHIFQKQIIAKHYELCALAESSNRLSCNCGGVEVDSFDDIPIDADENLYKIKGYELPGPSNNVNFTPNKQIGINLIVLQNSGANPMNFQDIPQHSNALFDAFNNSIFSLRNRYINLDVASDPLDGSLDGLPPPFNAATNSSRIEFFLANIFYLPVSSGVFQLNYAQGSNQASLINLARATFGCVIDENINYFLVNTLSAGAGVAILPTCNINASQAVFTKDCYGSYIANGANIPGNNVGYGHWIWAFTTHIAHEMGHILDLFHTYNSPPPCFPEDDDNDFDPLDLYLIAPNGNNLLCPHAGNVPATGCPSLIDPFINDPTQPCYTRNTNNMMSGLFLNSHYLSPRQKGKIHKATSLTSLRKYVDNCPYSAVPRIINSTQELHLDIRLYNDLIVPQGKTLTINCRIEFPDAGRLVIEPGARVILAPGAVLTSSCTMWAGVRVQGISSQAQGIINNTTQGVLIMQQGSTIENAEEAIFTSNINGEIYNSAGGIVQADGAIFRNNYRSAAFHIYNFPSISFFKNCHFIRDAHLRNPAYQNPDGSWQGSKHFVTIWRHNGIDFTDNTFESTLNYDITSNCSTSSYSWGDNDRGTGIGTFDAQFDLISTNPTAGQRNRFINLTRGIEARVTNNSLAFNFSTDGSEFTNVKYAIFTEHGNNDNINNNDFVSLNPDGSGGPETPNSYALYLHNYRFADVQFNTFTGTQNPQPEEWGIVAQQLNGNSSGTIARNDFTSLNRAFQAQRNNTSLEIKCNEFLNNQLDWHVNPLTLGNFANQGVGCNANDYRPGNLFLDQGQNHILSQQVISQNGTPAPAWIYFSRSDSPNNETPQFQNNPNFGTSNNCLNQTSLPNPCPNGTGARLSNDLQAIRLGLESEIDFLQSSVTLLEDSLDHQQTDSLLALIADTSISTSNVHTALYNHSPLSDTVMISFLERDSITSAQFISLFSFNLPGSARLMDSIYAYSLTHPLDTTTWDSLQKLQAYNPNMESITQKQRSIAFYRAEWKRVVAKTERALINENKLDDLVAFYKDSLGAGYEKETFGAYLAAGNVQSARNWLQNSFPQNNANDSAFVSYHNLYLDLMEDSISWLQLNSSQLVQIQQWANQESEIQHLALNVLALRGDTALNELPEFSNPPLAKFAHTGFIAPNGFVDTKTSISVFPNPSNGLFTLELENELENLRVGVYDITGRNVFEYQWRNKAKTQTISLQHLSHGVYYLQVRSGNQFIGVKPVVIQP